MYLRRIELVTNIIRSPPHIDRILLCSTGIHFTMFYWVPSYAMRHFPRDPMEIIPWDGMGWDSTHYISQGTYGTEINEQEIENLLNEHSDSEYECQNDNEL